jgi:hypothetical protein
MSAPQGRVLRHTKQEADRARDSVEIRAEAHAPLAFGFICLGTRPCEALILPELCCSFHVFPSCAHCTNESHCASSNVQELRDSIA